MKQTPTLEQIHEAVNIHFGFVNDEIFTKSRALKYVEPRQMFHYLASELTNEKLSKISLYGRKMNHATIIHSINQMKGYLEFDCNCRKSVSEVKEIINNMMKNMSSECQVRCWLKNNNLSDLNESIITLLVNFKKDLELKNI